MDPLWAVIFLLSGIFVGGVAAFVYLQRAYLEEFRSMAERLDRFEPTTQRTIALLANLVLFIVTALFHLRHVPAEGRLVSRFLWDLLFSELVLWAIAPWFLALQRQALELADPLAASEDRRQVD